MAPPPPHPCYLPSCDYTTVPGLTAESLLKDLDMHMKFAHADLTYLSYGCFCWW